MKPKRQRCLLCRRIIKSNIIDGDESKSDLNLSKDYREILNFGGSENNVNLNKQLWNVFIVRRLLQLPQSLCKHILQISNGRKNPSTWFVICGERDSSCLDTFEEAWKIHNQISELEQKLNEVGKRIRLEIRERKRSKNNEGVERDNGTVIERKIWKWLDSQVDQTKSTPSQSPSCSPLPEVKREVTSSPEPDCNDDTNSNNDQLADPDWDATEFLKRDPSEDGNTQDIPLDDSLVKSEIEEDDDDKQEDKVLSTLGSDGEAEGRFSDSELSFSDDEDVWEPKRRKRTNRTPKANKNVEKIDENNEVVTRRPRGRPRKSTTTTANSRSKDSVRKAKSSLRSKKSDGEMRRKYGRKVRVECSKCPAAFRNEAEYAPHQKLHQRCDDMENEFDCKTCGYPCESERTLRQHMSLKHELQKYICDVCGYEAPRKGRLARHKKLHMNMVDAKTYQCDICQEKFNNYIGFTRHQRKEHAEELNISLFKCDKCPSAYTTNKMLQDHILHVHERNSKWCCDICGKGLLSEKNLKEHLETHEHRERSEICWVCGVDFLNNRSLREHVRKFHPAQHNTKYAKAHPQKEEPDKEFKCLYCTFTSPFRLVVMRHRKTHRDVFRHLCEICSNEYSSLASLVLHKKIAHGDGKTMVQCDWCKKSFAHKHYLQNHMPRCKMRPPDIILPKTKKPFRDSLLVTPQGDEEDPLPAPPPPLEIPEKAEDSTALNLKSDIDSKSILCKYCKSFRTDNRGKMYDHVMKVHKDQLEFKYACDICDVKYTTKPSLNRHMAIHHSTGNMMACQYCQKVFRHWSLLRLHYKHSCKLMPAGAPIPEAPNKKEQKKEKKERVRKPKVTKFRVPRKRGKGEGRRKGGGIMEDMFYGQGSDTNLGQDDSMEMGGVEGGSGGNFMEPQPSTSTSASSPFPLMYAAGGGPGMGINPGGGGGNMSSAAAAAMHMFSAYNSGPGSGSSGGHRGWW